MRHLSRGHISFIKLLPAVLLALCCDIASGETIRKTTVDFALNVPDGFIELEPGPGMLFAFATSDPEDGFPDAVLGIKRLRKQIGPENIGVPPSAPTGSRTSNVKWRGFDLEVLVMPMSKDGVELEARSVQIPIRDQAIQFSMVVPKEKAANADALLQAFVSGLDGPTNWARPMTRGEQTGYLAGGVGGIALILGIIATLFYVSRRRRKARQLLGRPFFRDAPNVQVNRAIVHGVIAGFAVFLSLMCVWLIVVGSGPPIVANAGERMEDLIEGAIKFSLVCGGITFGISAWLQKRRAAKLPPPPIRMTPAAQAVTGFDQIVDDRE